MAGIDAFTVLCLQFNEADTSTTTVDSSLTPKTVTANGNVQTDSGVTKFGNTSLHDGTGDFWSLADSADWQLDGGSDSNAWTIDFWVRFNGDPGTADGGFITQRVDNDNHWRLQLSNGADLQFFVRSGGTNTVSIAQSWNPADATFYHVAVVKNGTLGYLYFIDGVQTGLTTTDTSTIPDFAGGLVVGVAYGSSGTELSLPMSLDEFRISKGIARWTTDFTPPTEQYSTDSVLIRKMMLMGVC